MKRSLRSVVALGGVLVLSSISARLLETPRPDEYAHLRYPVHYHYDKEHDGWCFNWGVGGVGYYRSADKAFADENCSCDDNACDKVPYSTLIFGKSSFRFEEAFPGGVMNTTTANATNNPFISISTITPNLEYRETGILFKGYLGTQFDCWGCSHRMGVRARLPFRDIEVSDPCGISDLTGVTLRDVYQVRNEPNPFGGATNVNTVYAVRLDFLSALNQQYMPVQRMVDYHSTAYSATGNITVAGTRVDEGSSAEVPPMVLLGADNAGHAPVATNWGASLTEGQVAIMPQLTAAGEGASTTTYARFINTTNYTSLATNRAAQSALFVVPRVEATPTGVLVPGATSIKSAIDIAVQGIDDSVADFVEETGLNLCDGRTSGPGDLDLEFFLGRNFGCDGDFWAELLFGARFPTSKELCNCLDVLKQPAGNNGHFDLRIGAAGGWNMCDWAKFMLDGQYGWVLKHEESVAAPFTGATIKNVGPCINADIKWSYFVGHADLSFYANDCCGFDLGYELYYKHCDEITLCAATATDFAGRTGQTLDPCILSNGTRIIANKIRTGVFTTMGDCEIMGGWSRVVGGDNAPRDTDWYLRMCVHF